MKSYLFTPKLEESDNTSQLMMLSFSPYPDDSTIFVFEPDNDTELDDDLVKVRGSHKFKIVHIKAQNVGNNLGN